MVSSGKGSGAVIPAVAGTGAAILPVTGASWAIPAAAALAAVLVFWGVVYMIRQRKNG